MKDKKFDIAAVITVILLNSILNEGVYYLARLITGGMKHHNMTLHFDLMIPFLPWTVLIYFGCFAFWIVAYIVIAMTGPAEGEIDNRWRVFSADGLSKFIALIFFIALPTTLIRPETGCENLMDTFATLLYQIDSADNLFPSLHCSISWFCWIGARSNKRIPAWFRNLCLIMAILVCIATLTTKQHVIVDIFAGIILAEGCYWLTGFESIARLYMVPAEKLAEAIRRALPKLTH